MVFTLDKRFASGKSFFFDHANWTFQTPALIGVLLFFLCPRQSPTPPPSTKKVTPTKTTPKPKKPKTTPTPTYLPGLTIAITDESQFCLLLPSSPGNRDNYNGTIDPDAIADTEKNAVVFCTEEELVPGARPMPDGFITSAEYQFNTTAEFVQIRGKIDREKYDLSKADGGGQVKSIHIHVH